MGGEASVKRGWLGMIRSLCGWEKEMIRLQGYEKKEKKKHF